MARARDAFVLAVLLTQLGAALPGLLHDRLDTRGDFSWNMYAFRYRCQVDYAIELPDGTRHPVDLGRAFNEPEYAGRALHRDRLPALHAFLCAHREDPASRIEGSVRCAVNARPAVELLRAGADLCSAPDWGVLP